MIARIKTNLIKYFFFGNSITDDGSLRLAYLLARFVVFLPLSLCATLILGVHSIFRPVKIFMLRCDRSKISFIVFDLEFALRIEAHNNKISGRKPALLFAVLDCDSPNKAFTAMYGRVLPFLDNKKFFTRGIIRYTLPFLRIQRVYLPNKQPDRFKIWANQDSTISFNSSEIKLGRKQERDILTNESKKFICIGLPEKSYYESKIQKKHVIPTSSDSYDYFPSWQNYFPSTQSLISLGYEVLRMGQIIDTSLDQVHNPGIIDYASNHRSEFGDVWLLANCKFVVAGGTGLYWISAAFNVPTVYTDAYSLSHSTPGSTDLMTFQLAWSRSEKKILPIQWLIKNVDWAQNRSLLNSDVEIIKNSAEEISEVVLEMNQRLDGTWIETDEDRELQARFSALWASLPKWRIQAGVRIGADFLRRYQHLL